MATSLMPSYDQLHQNKYGKPVSPEARAVEVPVWNALLDDAIARIDQAKYDYVGGADFHSAAVARDLAEALRALKSDFGGTAAT